MNIDNKYTFIDNIQYCYIFSVKLVEKGLQAFFTEKYSMNIKMCGMSDIIS